MLSKVNKNLLAILLIIAFINTYVFEIEVVNVILALFMFAIVIYANKDILKTLSIIEMVCVLAFVLAIIALFVGFMYVIINPVIEFISIGWLNYLLKVIVVIFTFIPLLGLLYKGMHKITKGKFPVMDIEAESDDIDYPDNEVIQQLVAEGKVVEAVKTGREIYGYSLLEAKRYVDQINNH